ncbi:MAG: hypothetical protein K0R72_1258 [Clostridia bacterium]|nr:hypothetical protein [Clostridia bacterium]
MDMKKILKIAEKVKIAEKDIESITEYLKYDEWGIAFEILCSAIISDSINVSNQEYVEIKEIGEYMKMDK